MSLPMKIFAHRGASGEYPENTLLAFEQAIIQQSDGIELDIQFHRSGTLLVLHDRFVKLNNGSIVYFDDLSLAEIESIDLPRHQKIPTLAQALSLIAGRCIVNIEIKTADDSPYTIAGLTELLQHDINYAIAHSGFNESQLLISSFNHALLLAVKSVFPQIHTAALIAAIPLNLANFAKQLSVAALNPYINCLNQSLIDSAHNNGLNVNVFTVDHPHDIQQCLQWRVDGIFTNYPAHTRKIIEACLSHR